MDDTWLFVLLFNGQFFQKVTVSTQTNARLKYGTFCNVLYFLVSVYFLNFIEEQNSFRVWMDKEK